MAKSSGKIKVSLDLGNIPPRLPSSSVKVKMYIPLKELDRLKGLSKTLQCSPSAFTGYIVGEVVSQCLDKDPGVLLAAKKDIKKRLKEHQRERENPPCEVCGKRKCTIHTVISTGNYRDCWTRNWD